LEWKLFAELFPPEPTKRWRGMPHTPVHQVVIMVRYILITACRWCDLLRSPQWASKSATHRWLQLWQADGTLAAMPARLLRLPETRRVIQWQLGGVGGSFRSWQRGDKGTPMTEKAKGFSPRAFRLVRACHCHRARRRPMGTSGLKSCRC
jgi:putative transposase of IS4/5 family DUF4096